MQLRSLQIALGPSPQILLKQGLIDAEEFDFLLRFPVEASKLSPVPFLSPYTWGAIKVLYTVDYCHFNTDNILTRLRGILQCVLFGFRQFLQWRISRDWTET